MKNRSEQYSRKRVATTNRPRLLCVQDGGEIESRLTHALPHCSIVRAHTAQQAMVAVQNETFDFYIVAARLPDVDGVDLSRRIRKFDPNTPLLLFYDDAEGMPYPEVEDSVSQGCLSAPVDLIVVRVLIDALLESARIANVRARAAEVDAMHDHLRERLDTVERDVRATEKVLEGQAMLMAKAYNAFAAAKGTRAEFFRLWPAVLEQVDRRPG
ncbi:MAG TPA: response regulator [Burkholderiales bacterium]|nr:response regulator [Burkholderiales bacterium]